MHPSERSDHLTVVVGPLRDLVDVAVLNLDSVPDRPLHVVGQSSRPHPVHHLRRQVERRLVPARRRVRTMQRG